MKNYEQAKDVLAPILTKPGNWAARITPQGEEYTLSDGSTLWVNDSEEVGKRFALLCLDEDYIHGRIEDEGAFEQVLSILENMKTCDACERIVDPDDCFKRGEFDDRMRMKSASYYYCDGECFEAHTGYSFV